MTLLTRAGSIPRTTTPETCAPEVSITCRKVGDAATTPGRLAISASSCSCSRDWFARFHQCDMGIDTEQLVAQSFFEPVITAMTTFNVITASMTRIEITVIKEIKVRGVGRK
jgi:hypothetical protein